MTEPVVVPFRLIDLPELHPELLWDTLLVAAAAILLETGSEPPISFALTIENVLGFGNETCRFVIDTHGISPKRIEQVRKTYEPSRLVELAAIALAGVGLFHAGQHEIIDLSLRGSAADYLVDQARHVLEIAGRSRRADLAAAWQQRVERLAHRRKQGFYLCVCEFETMTGRLAFHLEE